jgi:hypothetical protein
MIRGKSLVGAQPTSVLERFLEENGALRNPPLLDL